MRANDETFANTEYYPVDPGPAGIATGDIDGDLYDDLLFVDADSGFGRTLVNRRDGTFFVRGGTEDAGLSVLLTRCLAPRER